MKFQGILFQKLGIASASVGIAVLVCIALASTLESSSSIREFNDHKIWGRPAHGERREVEEDMKKYKMLWKSNKKEIMGKINQEYLEFKNQLEAEKASKEK